MENGTKVSYRTFGIITTAVIITAGIVVWLSAELNGKASCEKVSTLENQVVNMRILLERIASKLGVDTH